MNIIPFVFALLLIFSYSIAASFQARLLSHKNQKAFLSLRGAELDILRKSELEQFKSLAGEAVKKPKQQRLKEKKPEKEKKKEPLPLNTPCAKLNLYPLVIEGREMHQALYDSVAKTLRVFYQGHFFPTEKRFEYKLLDAILAGAKEKLRGKTKLAIETISLKDPNLQPMYYALLKGTKHYELGVTGYPPLIDYWKMEKEASKICLFHGHPDILTVFFGAKTAAKLYEELHDGSNKAVLTLDAIFAWGTDPELRMVPQDVWDLIDFKRPQHGKESFQTLVGQEEDALIRKNILLKSKK